MTDSPVIIHVEGLTKLYGLTRAVNGISFDVRKGEVLGFLAPAAGRATVAGFDCYAQSLEVRRRIGYLPEDTPLYKDMTVLEYLEYVTELRRIPANERRRRIKAIREV